MVTSDSLLVTPYGAVVGRLSPPHLWESLPFLAATLLLFAASAARSTLHALGHLVQLITAGLTAGCDNSALVCRFGVSDPRLHGHHRFPIRRRREGVSEQRVALMENRHQLAMDQPQERLFQVEEELRQVLANHLILRGQVEQIHHASKDEAELPFPTFRVRPLLRRHRRKPQPRVVDAKRGHHSRRQFDLDETILVLFVLTDETILEEDGELVADRKLDEGFAIKSQDRPAGRADARPNPEDVVLAAVTLHGLDPDAVRQRGVDLDERGRDLFFRRPPQRRERLPPFQRHIMNDSAIDHRHHPILRMVEGTRIAIDRYEPLTHPDGRIKSVLKSKRHTLGQADIAGAEGVCGQMQVQLLLGSQVKLGHWITP